MSTWMTALQAEIDSKKAELTKLKDVQKQIATLGVEISHLEGILSDASKPPKAAKTVKAKRAGGRTWSPEQKKAASVARLAANAAKGVTARPKKA